MKAKLLNIQALLTELQAPLFATEAGREQRPKLDDALAAIVEALPLCEYTRPDQHEIARLVRVALTELSQISIAPGTRAYEHRRLAVRACEGFLADLGPV